MQSNFIEHELPNGLRIVCEVIPRVSSAAVAFCARTGSGDEAAHLHGVSHFLEHMCFKGTAKRDCHSINVRFDELGSMYNAFTSKQRTVYYGWLPATRVVEQIELLADMMRPALPPDEYETERKVILEEIAMSDDSFEHHVSDYLHKVVFDGHPLSHEILGEKETIEKLPREAMVDYHRQRYAPDNMVLVATGAIRPEEVFAAAGRFCEDWQRSTNGAPAARPEVRITPAVHKHKLGQFKQQSIILIYPSVPESHPDAEVIELFSSLFGGANSRCYWNIVQKGICQQAGAAWLAYRDCGLMALFADGEPDRGEDMLSALRAQAEAVVREGVQAAEVDRVKNRRRTQLAIEGENPRTRLMQILDDLQERGAARTTDARLAAVEAVTPARIAEHLERFPVTGETMLLSVGPRDWPE